MSKQESNDFVFVFLGGDESVVLKSYHTLSDLDKREANKLDFCKCRNEIQSFVENEDIKFSKTDSPQKNTLYLSSQGYLIQKLATNYVGIPEQNVKVFGLGRKENFNVCKLTNGKSIIQFNFHETEDPMLFVSQETIHDTNFYFCESLESLFLDIKKILNNHHGARIWLFLTNNVNTNTFGPLTYLEIYLLFLRMNPNFLRIFIDSCHNQLMGFYIEKLNKLIQRINLACLTGCTEKITIMHLMVIFKAVVLSGKGPNEGFDYIKSLISQMQGMVVDLNYLYLQIHELPQYVRALKTPQMLLSDFVDIIPNKNVAFDFYNAVEFLEEVGIDTIGKYNELNIIFEAWNEYNKLEKSEHLTSVLNPDMVDIVQRIFNAVPSDLQAFLDDINLLYSH